nr:MAG TPA: hypothetical protein [Caudoviricetes sp.]
MLWGRGALMPRPGVEPGRLVVLGGRSGGQALSGWL